MTMGIVHVLPHKAPSWRPVHVLAMLLLAVNFFFNYTRAILADPGAAGGPSYERLLRHARDAGLVSSQDYERQQRGALSVSTINDPMFALPAEDPFSWSFCQRSGKLKPPRAHFDGVTNQLVLNMDHYCVRIALCRSTCMQLHCSLNNSPLLLCSTGVGLQRHWLWKLPILPPDCSRTLVCISLWFFRNNRSIHSAARTMDGAERDAWQCYSHCTAGSCGGSCSTGNRGAVAAASSVRGLHHSDRTLCRVAHVALRSERKNHYRGLPSHCHGGARGRRCSSFDGQPVQLGVSKRKLESMLCQSQLLCGTVRSYM